MKHRQCQEHGTRQPQRQQQDQGGAGRGKLRLTRGDRGTLLLLMSDPLFQQTKLGAAFTPAQQHRSLRFAQLAAAYLGQPVALVLLECLRLRQGGWGTG